MEINFLQADHGDSILISYHNNGQEKNILIDGGPRTAYEYGQRPTKNGSLKNCLEAIKLSSKKIDLLVLTHVDDDHIAGLLAWFSSNDFDPSLIKKTWFNSGSLINDYFGENLENENSLFLRRFDSPNTSIRQGVSFANWIEEHNLWEKKIIKAGDEYHIDGAKITILSPTEKELKSLLVMWEDEAPDTLTSGHGNDYNKSIDELLEVDTFKEDKSIHNGSSIAFLIEVNGKKALLLGDAYATAVTQSLKEIGYSSDIPLEVDIVKVSHHGSKGNTNNDLLSLLECKKFVISTNGARHSLPHKRTLARIIKKNPACELYFNYPELIKKIFTEDEKNDSRFYLLDSKELTL